MGFGYTFLKINNKFLKCGSTSNIDTISVKINWRKRKLLLSCYYIPHKNFILSYLSYLDKILDTYSKSYENLVFIIDFNVSMGNKGIVDFCELNVLTSLTDKTKYSMKIFNKSTWFDLTSSIEFKIGSQNIKPQIITYHNY